MTTISDALVKYMKLRVISLKESIYLVETLVRLFQEKFDP